MKNLIMFLFLSFILIFSACQKVEYVEPTDPDSSSGITLKAGLGGASIIGDTITVELKRQVAFRIEFAFAAPNNVIVTTNAGNIPVEPDNYFQNQWSQTGLYWLKISALDAGNQLHQKTFQVKVVTSFADPVRFITVVPITGTDFFQVTVALSKNGMPVGPHPYAYVGSITTPIWQNTYFAAADTNYRLENGALYLASGIGAWVSTKFTIQPGEYEFGAGKIIGGQLVWGSFFGSSFVGDYAPTLIKFRLSSTGVITSNITGGGSSLPGNIGDNVVRFGENADGSWDILVNNQVDFNSMPEPFIRIMNPNELWATPVPQQMVTDFGQWGKISLNPPFVEVIKFQFGTNAQVPNYVSNVMGESLYWDTRYQYLAVSFITVPVTTADGQTFLLTRPRLPVLMR